MEAAWLHVRVVVSHFVAVLAKPGSDGYGRNGLTPEHVDLRRNRLKVIGIYASSVAAQVIDMQVIGDAAHVVLE